MSKRCRRSKPWDGFEDVVHNPDGSWSGKLYMALKPCKEPHLELQWNGYGGKNQKFIDVTKKSGLGYFEDEKGYYSMTGELICTAD